MSRWRIEADDAKQDNILDRMAPSDLRLLIGERDRAEAEAQALRGEVADLRLELGGMQMEMAEVAYRLSPSLLTELKRLVAFAYDQAIEGAEEAGRQLEGLMGQEALRARVVVVPERAHESRGDDGAEGWNACLDELSRLNGKAVSEGLLRRIAAPRPSSIGEEPAWRLDQGKAIEELSALLDGEPT